MCIINYERMYLSMVQPSYYWIYYSQLSIFIVVQERDKTACRFFQKHREKKKEGSLGLHMCTERSSWENYCFGEKIWFCTSWNCKSIVCKCYQGKSKTTFECIYKYCCIALVLEWLNIMGLDRTVTDRYSNGISALELIGVSRTVFEYVAMAYRSWMTVIVYFLRRFYVISDLTHEFDRSANEGQ